MSKFIWEILNNPFWTVTTTFILWAVFYNLLTFLKISDIKWKQLEYIWIFIGFLGLISINVKNDKDFKLREREDAKNNISLALSRLQYLLQDEISCQYYTRSNMSPPNFLDIQFDQIQVCNWSKNFHIEIDSLENVPISYLNITALKTIKFKTNTMNWYVADFNKWSTIINSNIQKFNKLNFSVRSSSWEDFNRSIGLFLIIIAFSIRLSIATRNVKILKKR